MKLKAKDTIHVSSVRADPIRAGETFEVNDSEGRQLVDRGLATKVVEPKAKKAPAAKNKMAAAPANKAAGRKRR